MLLGSMWAGNGDQQLLAGLLRHPLDACHAADGQQRYVARADAEAACDEDMTELVGEHAGKDQDDEHDGIQCLRLAVLRTNRNGIPGDQEKERQVDANLGPEKATERDRPAHDM
jgi:hypothetical protein